MELKNKCDAIEKRETEKRQLEEKKHQEEIQALRKTNQQLKVRLLVKLYVYECSACVGISHTGSVGRHNYSTEKVASNNSYHRLN